MRPIYLVLISLAMWAVVLAGIGAAFARGDGWDDTPAAVRQWFQNLMQPDAPGGV